MQKDELISLANEMCKELSTIIDQQECIKKANGYGKEVNGI